MAPTGLHGLHVFATLSAPATIKSRLLYFRRRSFTPHHCRHRRSCSGPQHHGSVLLMNVSGACQGARGAGTLARLREGEQHTQRSVRTNTEYKNEEIQRSKNTKTLL